jgi:Na+-driven multidrug efflux pump
MQFILGGYLINMGIKGMGINMIIVHLANLILILLYCRHMDYLKLDLISNKDEVLSEMKEYS